MERVMGIEPTLVAWEATVLPLNYTRMRSRLLKLAIMRVDPSSASGTPLITDSAPSRAVKSFARREGRMTLGQERALAELGPKVLINDPLAQPFDPTAVFGRVAARHLDVGFGAGESIAQSALLHPDQDYLGLEVHRPGVGQLLLKLNADGTENVRVAVVDAVEFLTQVVAPETFSSVRIFCPDPWPKQRHVKRRLIQDEFMQLLKRALILGGDIYLATDWAPYANHMLKVLSRAPGLRNTNPAGGFAERYIERPPTRFEKRGEKLGHAVFDLHFVRSE
jgi:tRNA (guanine-N7-)-methyltransferase